MPKYTVHFPRTAWYAVTVERDDDDFDAVLDEAYEALPEGVCAQCSGWNEKWRLDLDTMDIEAKVVTTEALQGPDAVVWGSWDDEKD